jgi:hypothetical protein
MRSRAAAFFSQEAKKLAPLKIALNAGVERKNEIYL